MTGKTINRVDLTAAVYDTVSLSRAEAAGLVEQVLGDERSSRIGRAREAFELWRLHRAP
jgi:hypothetical protein